MLPQRLKLVLAKGLGENLLVDERAPQVHQMYSFVDHEYKQTYTNKSMRGFVRVCPDPSNEESGEQHYRWKDPYSKT